MRFAPVQVAVGSSTTYKATDVCASPANDTGFFDPGDAVLPLCTGWTVEAFLTYCVQRMSLPNSHAL